MKVLIACEESQSECKAFRARGHEAYSLDLRPCSGGHPEWHILSDALFFDYSTFDLVIAHPPCTYLSKAGSLLLFNKDHSIRDIKRYCRGLAARDFFMFFYNLRDCVPRLAIENPEPLKIFHLPKHSQYVCPSWFGSKYSKRTYLWLYNLPPLMATCITEDPRCFTSSRGSSFYRSKSFDCISNAMAYQWG